jgi:hypothetical protein
MKTSLSLLDNVRVASPCPADWDQMHGTDRVRHCQQFDLKVYNLSEMSRADATDLVLKEEGRLCVRFYRRTDGTMLTKDCPKGLLRRGWSAARYLAGAALSLIGCSFLVGCQQKEPPIMGQMVYYDTAPTNTKDGSEPKMGKPVPPTTPESRPTSPTSPKP